MKRAIPQPSANQTDINRAVKENLEQIMAHRLPAIKDVATTATTAELAAKINEIIARLQE